MTQLMSAPSREVVFCHASSVENLFVLLLPAFVKMCGRLACLSSRCRC